MHNAGNKATILFLTSSWVIITRLRCSLVTKTWLARSTVSMSHFVSSAKGLHRWHVGQKGEEGQAGCSRWYRVHIPTCMNAHASRFAQTHAAWRTHESIAAIRTESPPAAITAPGTHDHQQKLIYLSVSLACNILRWRLAKRRAGGTAHWTTPAFTSHPATLPPYLLPDETTRSLEYDHILAAYTLPYHPTHPSTDVFFISMDVCFPCCSPHCQVGERDWEEGSERKHYHATTPHPYLFIFVNLARRFKTRFS